MKRQPAGTPTGGQYAPDPKSADPSDLTLTSPTVPNEEPALPAPDYTSMLAQVRQIVPTDITNPDVIASWIREADGNNSLGAGTLGEMIADRISEEIELANPYEAPNRPETDNLYATLHAEHLARVKGETDCQRIADSIASLRAEHEADPHKRMRERRYDYEEYPNDGYGLDSEFAYGEQDANEIVADQYVGLATQKMEEFHDQEVDGLPWNWNAEQSYVKALEYAENTLRRPYPIDPLSRHDIERLMQERLRDGSASAPMLMQSLQDFGARKEDVSQVFAQYVATGRLDLANSFFVNTPYASADNC